MTQNNESEQAGLIDESEFGARELPNDNPPKNGLRNLSFPDMARFHVMMYVKHVLEKTDTHVRFKESDVYVVWFSKTLQNWKALVSTTLSDGMYYEVTYNGDKRETYIDAYKKWDNVCVPDEEN